MTIDEAIEKFKFIANSDTPCPRYCMLPCDKCVQESEQLAEWLEELKELRNITASHLYAVAFNRGYLKAEKEERNMAIDDFAESVKNLISDSSVIMFKDIEEIAEQLKEGVRNGAYNQ